MTVFKGRKHYCLIKLLNKQWVMINTISLQVNKTNLIIFEILTQNRIMVMTKEITFKTKEVFYLLSFLFILTKRNIK